MPPSPSQRSPSGPRTHCAACGVELADSNCKRRHDASTFRSHCDACRSSARRARNDSAETHIRLFVTREVCDICKQPERAKRNGVVRALNKDHDHKTGEWRGLLCSRCNNAIGLFRDNVYLLQSAIEYLNNPPGLVLVDDGPLEERQDWRKPLP